MGGPDSHRGFNYNRLSVQVPIGYPGAPNLPIGGDQLLLLQGELRVNIVKLYGNWFGITAFLDAGDVAAPSSSGNLEAVLAPSASPTPGGICGNGQTPKFSSTVQLSKLHTAVGGGLRYKTVIGTIRADVGVRVNRTAHLRAGRHAQSRSGVARRIPHLDRGELLMRALKIIGKVIGWIRAGRAAAGGVDAADGGDRRAHRLGASQDLARSRCPRSRSSSPGT